MEMSKYDLVGVNGNAFSVMGYVINAMKECGFSMQEIDAYRADATSGDYDHLLNISFEMVEECNSRVEMKEFLIRIITGLSE
jgi:hypothetical protein